MQLKISRQSRLAKNVCVPQRARGANNLNMDEQRPPSEHKQTWRDALYFALREGPETIRELSIRLGASQKDLLEHLAHLERSLGRTGEHLVVDPARCLACNYVFADRTRLAKPGRCPSCKGTRITLPRFSLATD